MRFLKTDVHPFCLKEGTRRLEMDHPVKVIKQNFLDENMEILQANLLSFDKTQLIVDVLHLSEEKQTNLCPSKSQLEEYTWNGLYVEFRHCFPVDDRLVCSFALFMTRAT